MVSKTNVLSIIEEDYEIFEAATDEEALALFRKKYPNDPCSCELFVECWHDAISEHEQWIWEEFGEEIERQMEKD